MRVNKTASVVLSTAIAGSLAAGGFTAATAFAADEPRDRVVQEASAPQAEKFAAQAKLLGATGNVLQPVEEVIDEVLAARNGQLSQAVAQKHAQAVKEALAPLTQPAAPKQQGGQQQAGQREQAATPHALTVKAAGELRAQVDKLLQAAVTGQQQQLDAEVRSTIQAAVNLLSSIVVSGDLPRADLEGLPPMPRLSPSQQGQQEQGQRDSRQRESQAQREQRTPKA